MRRSIFGAFLGGLAAISLPAGGQDLEPVAAPPVKTSVKPSLASTEKAPEIYINVDAQKLFVVKGGLSVMSFPISTSRFGLGDTPRSYKTPLGRFKVNSKAGEHLPLGAVLKGGRFTGEVLAPNSPGRDPIVTRIIRLQGLEEQNRRALSRGIYIHGTPEEKNIGKPVSWGCIRMRSKDVVALYQQVDIGTPVIITARKALSHKPVATAGSSERRLKDEARRIVSR